MNRSSIAKVTASAFAAGLASLALASPAQAQQPPAPGDSGVTGTVSTSGTSEETGWNVGQLAAGAAGGIVLAGAGAAAVAGVRRRHGHLAHA